MGLQEQNKFYKELLRDFQHLWGFSGAVQEEIW